MIRSSRCRRTTQTAIAQVSSVKQRTSRRKDPDPKIAFDIEAELLERRHIGRAPCAENGERAQLARLMCASVAGAD
jgi:hypothetical protein